MKLAATLLLCVAGLSAQTNTTTTSPKNPLVATSQAIFGIAKNDILRSADKIPDDMWSFQPTPDVRTVGQLFAHVADAQYEFCGTVAEGKAPQKDIEKTAKTKTDIVTALKTAFAYCDAAYTKMTDASAAQMTTFFGRQVTQLGLMDFNAAHTFEHYGNLVTYMRIKGIVPPSSEAQK
jgi:uncharacterized damage-inducible protein DinB